jgi:hypothetical protein
MVEVETGAFSGRRGRDRCEQETRLEWGRTGENASERKTDGKEKRKTGTSGESGFK